jgi:hypothetical protein
MPIRARLINGQWEFLHDGNTPTGFYLKSGDSKQFKKLGILEVDGEHVNSEQDLTIYPPSKYLLEA